MQIVEHMNADSMVLTMVGRMDFQARKVFQCAIENATFSRPHQIILKFSNVPFIDSTGIGLLMVAHKSLTQSQIALSLEVPQGYVMDVLNFASIGKTIAISDAEVQSSPSFSPRLTPPLTDHLT